MPILLAKPAMAMGPSMHHAMPPLNAPLGTPVIILAVGIHTLSLLIVAGLLANTFYLTYEKSALGFLRHAWLNFDLLWALALFVAGVLALLV